MFNPRDERIRELESLYKIAKQHIDDLERKLEESHQRIERLIDARGKSEDNFYAKCKQLAERDALIRELIKVVKELQGGFIRIEGHVTPTDKLLARAKGVVGE